MTTTPDPASGPNPPRSLRTLWVLLAVCLLPFVASLGLYFFAPPKERMNYGELLVPTPLPEIAGTGIEDQPAQLGSLKGQWVLLHIDSGACNDRCLAKQYKLRQVRLTQGKNMERVARAWLVVDRAPLGAAVLRDYAGIKVIRVAPDVLKNFPAATGADLRDHIWLIDPLGNLMLRYPPAADPSGMKTDLQRLLKLSRIG